MRNFRQSATREAPEVRGLSRLLDEYEVSDLLGVRVSTLRYWRHTSVRRGPAFVKLGRLVRYPPEDLKRYLKKNSVRTMERASQHGRN